MWLNNPIRPLEACEHGRNGWAIGDGADGVPDQDAYDLAALYATLEGDVLPAYADRDRWVNIMQASIQVAAERFLSDRMVAESFTRLYARPDLVARWSDPCSIRRG